MGLFAELVLAPALPQETLALAKAQVGPHLAQIETFPSPSHLGPVKKLSLTSGGVERKSRRWQDNRKREPLLRHVPLGTLGLVCCQAGTRP